MVGSNSSKITCFSVEINPYLVMVLKVSLNLGSLNLDLSNSSGVVVLVFLALVLNFLLTLGSISKDLKKGKTKKKNKSRANCTRQGVEHNIDRNFKISMMHDAFTQVMMI